MSSLLSLGRRRPLEHNDLFDLLLGDATLTNEQALSEQLAKTFAEGGSFIRAWHRTYGPYFWTTGLLQVRRSRPLARRTFAERPCTRSHPDHQHNVHF